MPIRVLHEEWRETNIERRYPFADDATLTNGDVVIPENAILDAVLHPVGHTGQLFCSTISVSRQTITVQFSDGLRGVQASGQWGPGTDPSRIRMDDAMGRPAGLLVPGPGLTDIEGWSDKDHEFTFQQTALAPRCMLPMPDDGLGGLRREDDDAVYGHIWIVGENGVYLTLDDNRLRLDLIGDNLRNIRRCAETSVELSENLAQRIGLKTINNVGPDIVGEFNISIGSQLNYVPALRLLARNNTLTILGARDGRF